MTDKYQWQLEDLYPGFDSEEYQGDFEFLASSSQRLEGLDLEDDLASVRQIIDHLEDFTVVSRRLSAYIYLTLATDTSHPQASQERDRFYSLMAEMTGILTRIQTFLGQVTVDLSQDDKLSEYSFLFQRQKEANRYLLSEEIEKVIDMMALSGGRAWEAMYDYLVSQVEGELDGKTYTLTEIRNLAYDPDPALRKAAYELELSMYDQVKDAIAYALNNIKYQVINVGKLRGYASPLEETLFKSRMSRKTLDSLMGAIQDALPHFQRYMKRKGQVLGHDNGLPFYDLFAPLGETSRKFTVEESKDYLIEKFQPFAQDLADLVETMYRDQHIDFLPRKGKQGGAFCSNLPFIDQSRVLTNFDGSLSSVSTLAHELGHAYHGLHIQDHQPLNWGYSMPVAETASTFNETLIMESLMTEAKDPEEKLAILEALISDINQIITDIYSRYLFETAVFEGREEGFIFADQLKDIMLEAQKEAYGPGLDPDYLHPFMWVCKGHYYSTGLSFYNFPYAFGGLLARAIYAKSQAGDPDFLSQYQGFLRLTAVATVEEAGQALDFDVTDKAFWSQALDGVVALIEEFIKETDSLV